jgi:hypothetical protein
MATIKLQQGGIAFSVQPMANCCKWDKLGAAVSSVGVKQLLSWESKSWSNELVVGQSPAGKNMKMEAEGIGEDTAD